jgi:hypothetical protein
MQTENLTYDSVTDQAVSDELVAAAAEFTRQLKHDQKCGLTVVWSQDGDGIVVKMVQRVAVQHVWKGPGQ